MAHKSDEGLGLQPLERLPTAIGAVIGVVATGFEVWAIVRFLGSAESAPLQLFKNYLYVSFFALVILFLAAAWYHYRLIIRVGELTSREAAIRLQHYMAEEVRRCAADPGEYDWQSFANASHKVKEFLAQRLPDVRCSLTVKMVAGSRLRAVFRDPDQEIGQRCLGDDIALHDSHVYMSFRAQPRGEKRWVYVRDSENVASRPYVDRARSCGFRSVVAFPLREPAQFPRSSNAPGMDVAGIRGFWSLDSDEPDAFLDLFRADKVRRHTDNDGKGLMPRADIQAFYGIADCLATILMLMDAAAVSTKGNNAIP